MTEYFVMTKSFAAPFVSDTGKCFVEAETPEAALEQVAVTYRHPAGLYAAAVYRDANAYHKGEKPMARWLSAKAELLETIPHTRTYAKDASTVELDGIEHHLADPYAGRVIAPSPANAPALDSRPESGGNT